MLIQEVKPSGSTPKPTTGDEIMINRHIETALATAHVRAESARQWASETDRHLASMLNRSHTLVELLNKL